MLFSGGDKLGLGMAWYLDCVYVLATVDEDRLPLRVLNVSDVKNQK